MGVIVCCASIDTADELNARWNSVFRKIFGYRRYESVKDVIYGLGRVNLKHLLLLSTVKFY